MISENKSMTTWFKNIVVYHNQKTKPISEIIQRSTSYSIYLF